LIANHFIYYKIIGLNPNSAYHLSMKLNYSNEFDLKYANIEGKKFPIVPMYRYSGNDVHI